MKRFDLLLVGGIALAGCSSSNGTNPLTGGATSDATGQGAVLQDSVSTLEGTSTPKADDSITRLETEDGSGNGYANTFKYDKASDTFSVNNLGFDGNNVYTRDTAKPSIGPFKVYESALVYQDDVTGVPIGQFQHRAIYGVSKDNKAEFAIVRTGAYLPYGFGGFMYARNGKVTLPKPGTQAAFTGKYAALRDFNGSGGLEYAKGDMTMAIDLRDFDNGNAVQGRVFNRVIYDINGKDITKQVINAINTKDKASLTALPTIKFTVGPGVIDKNGELEGEVTSPFSNDAGKALDNGSGKYYAVLAGDNEVVGVIVTETGDRRADGVTVRETGGFILYRP